MPDNWEIRDCVRVSDAPNQVAVARTTNWEWVSP
jgi:hypothetical protein